MPRPESFEFAMSFLGDPEAKELRAYVEELERKCASLCQAYGGLLFLTSDLERATREVLRISERDHEAWKHAHELLDRCAMMHLNNGVPTPN